MALCPARSIIYWETYTPRQRRDFGANASVLLRSLALDGPALRGALESLTYTHNPSQPLTCDQVLRHTILRIKKKKKQYSSSVYVRGELA